MVPILFKDFYFWPNIEMFKKGFFKRKKVETNIRRGRTLKLINQ